MYFVDPRISDYVTKNQVFVSVLKTIPSVFLKYPHLSYTAPCFHCGKQAILFSISLSPPLSCKLSPKWLPVTYRRFKQDVGRIAVKTRPAWLFMDIWSHWYHTESRVEKTFWNSKSNVWNCVIKVPFSSKVNNLNSYWKDLAFIYTYITLLD